MDNIYNYTSRVKNKNGEIINPTKADVAEYNKKNYTFKSKELDPRTIKLTHTRKDQDEVEKAEPMNVTRKQDRKYWKLQEEKTKLRYSTTNPIIIKRREDAIKKGTDESVARDKKRGYFWMKGKNGMEKISNKPIPTVKNVSFNPKSLPKVKLKK